MDLSWHNRNNLKLLGSFASKPLQLPGKIAWNMENCIISVKLLCMRICYAMVIALLIAIRD